MSRNRDRNYSFKRHRDALYAILEAAVVAGGEAPKNDDVDVNSSGDDSSTAGRSRESNDDGGRISEETKKTYPSDFLWYEQMTSEDIDAYHAAHRGTPSSGEGGAPTTDPPSLDLRGTSPAAISRRRAHRHGEQGCLEASDGYGNGAAGEDEGGADYEVVVAEKDQAPPPPPPAFSPRLSAPPLRPTQHASGTGKGRASGPEFSSQLPVVSSAEMVQTPVIYSSSSASSGFSPTAVACKVPKIMIATAAVGDGSLEEPSKRLQPSSPQQEDPHPFDKAGSQEDQDAAVAAVAAASSPSSSSSAAAAAATTTALPTTDAQAHHVVVSRKWPEARKKGRPATTAAAATTAEAAMMTMTASEQSQATESMFLPGLPSQLLVTQQQDDGGWDHVADGDPQQHEGGEETASSEYALSLPAPHDNINDVPTWGVKEIAPDSRGVYGDGNSSSRRDAGSTELILPGDGGSGGTRGGDDFGPEIRARQNEGFTCVLRKFAGGSEHEGRGVAMGSAESARRGDGNGERSRQRLVLVPTQEVLPSGWVSGQAGVVGVLEDSLLRARERFHDGYTVRSLELACQVFRQSSVCVRTGGVREDSNIGQGFVAVARQVDSSGDDAEALPAGDHAEVVGVTGLVWEILRAEIANQRSVGLI